MNSDKELNSSIKRLIGLNIHSISVDETSLNINLLEKIRGEKIVINFDSGFCLTISTEDEPHFFGEGDLSLDLEKFNRNFLNIENPLWIEKIKLWYYRPTGFFSKKYLVQLEFYSIDKLMVSAGFFYQGIDNMDFLSTGELYISDVELKGEHKREFSFEVI